MPTAAPTLASPPSSVGTAMALSSESVIVKSLHLRGSNL
jgi:hypothetical protein